MIDFSPSAYVELNRSAFLEPDGLPKPHKSMFVSQKLTVSVGEVVNGGPLPPMPHHLPVSSFNAQNKYTGGSTSVDLASGSQKSSVEATGKSKQVFWLRSMLCWVSSVSRLILQSRNCSWLLWVEILV